MTDGTETQVVHGDHESRDGHYRAKRDLRQQSDESRRTCAEKLDNPSDADSLRAQNPEEFSGTLVGRACEEAAGLPAVVKTMQFGIGQMGPWHGTKTLLQVNQKDGFDCQSCAWPNPDDHRKIAEFCENGAKAVADEGSRKRITREFFARYSIDELAAKSDYWLNQQGRLTEAMVRHLGAQHYTPISWPDAFQLISGELNSLHSRDEAAFYTSGKTANEPAFLLQLFARQFGTSNLPDCSNMCHESSGVALVETLRVGKGVFTACSIPKHDLAPGEFLLMTIRTHDQFNSTIYGLDDRYRGIFGGRRVIFLNPQDVADAGWRVGQLVDIHSHFEGETRKARRFAIVPYSIPRRSAAAYYPETNVLVPIRSVAKKSNQPAYKCIRVTLHPSPDAEPGVKVSLPSIERNLQRTVG